MASSRKVRALDCEHGFCKVETEPERWLCHSPIRLWMQESRAFDGFKSSADCGRNQQGRRPVGGKSRQPTGPGASAKYEDQSGKRHRADRPGGNESFSTHLSHTRQPTN